MGSRNRERRKAKQKARAQRPRAQTAGPGSAPGTKQGPGRSDQAGGQRGSLRDTVEILISGALNAKIDNNDTALARCLDGLVAIPARVAGATGDRTVNRCLSGWFDRMVEAVWRRGWQPVDVHRIVQRRAAARHARLVVDAVAAQARRYAGATVDERWDAQLRALDAAVWWGDDDAWLDAWGDREGLRREEVLADAVELLCVLHGLPPLPLLGPPPGTVSGGIGARPPGQDARRGRTAGPGSGPSADPRILDRVRGLLAKAESTEFPEEAEALTTKAQQLMARHSIDEALLAAREGSANEPIGRRIGVDNPYEAAKALLLDAIANANRCRSVWAKELGFATVVGFPSDLDGVELLYTSLLVQATTAMTRAGSRRDVRGRSRTRAFRQSFLTSFAVRIGERLRAATERAGEDAAAETGRDRLLPVLVARDDTVREAAEAMFPQMVFTSVKAGDGEGWASGRAAADLASLRAHDEVPGAPAGVQLLRK